MTPQLPPAGQLAAGSPATARAITLTRLLSGVACLAGVVLLLTGLATDHGTLQTIGKIAIVLGVLLLLAFTLLSRRAVKRRQ